MEEKNREPLQCVISFKACSSCGGSGVIKKEEEASEERYVERLPGLNLLKSMITFPVNIPHM